MTETSRDGTSRQPVVRFERRGQRLLVKRLSPRIRQILQDQLTYEYVKQIRGQEARRTGRKVEIIPTECFQEIQDPHGVEAPQALTAAGFYPRLRKAFTQAGYLLDYQDNTPKPRRPNAYTPRWEQLQDVEFRYRQRELLEKITAAEYGRIVFPTGGGKSFLICQLCRLYPYARFAITTSSKDVIEMLYEDIGTVLPSVGLVHGGKKIEGKRVTCYSMKSLHRARGDEDFLLVDEAHEACTADNLLRIARFRNSRLFGFSANKPGDRMDGADFELEGPLGPVIFEMGYEEAVAHDLVVQLKVMWVDVVMDINPCEDAGTDTAKLRNGLWRNKVRNDKIAAVAGYWARQGKQVLVMVDTVEHACFLKQLLPEFTMVYGEGSLDHSDRAKYVRWGLIDNDEPEMDPHRRIQLKEQFERGELRTAIATGVWSRGVNFKQLQVLVRADGRSSAISDAQLPGRLARLSEDKRYGVLVDFADQFDRTFRRKADERRRRYHEMGWEQIEEDRSRVRRYRKKTTFAGGA